jgi:hypothetical protein
MAEMGASVGAATGLFRLLNEVVLFLLGAMLVLLAASQRLHPPRQVLTWILLGVILVYWGARAGMRPAPEAIGWQERLRGASFILAGALILPIAILPGFAPLLLGAAGAVLAARGLVMALAFARIGAGAARDGGAAPRG